MATNQQEKSRCTINKELLPLKVFYFFVFGACMVIPYISVVLRQLGLNPSEIGVITGSSVILCMFTRPSIGILADKLGGRKIMLIGCCMAFGICFFSLNFLDARPSTTSAEKEEAVDLWICRLHTSGNQLEELDEGVTTNNSNLQTNHSFCDLVESTTSKSGNEIEGRGIAISCPYHRSDQYSPPNCLSLIVNNSRSSNYLIYSMSFESNNDRTNAKVHGNYGKIANFTNSSAYTSLHVPGCLQPCEHSFRSFASKVGNTLVIPIDDNMTVKSSSAPDGSSIFNFVEPDSVFFQAFVVIFTARVFYSSTTSLADALAYTLLGANRHQFAMQRLWGALGIGTCVMTNAAVSFGLHKDHDLTVLFIMCLCLTFLASMVVLFKLNTESVDKTNDLLRDLCAVLSNPPFRLVLGKLLLFGLMAGAAQNFFMWFIADIGGSPFNLALTVVMNCISSIFMLRLTGLLLQRFGRQVAMYTVLVAYCIRFLAMSFIESPWMALPIELLHGITYSLLWAAASGTTSVLAPPGTQASCQSIAGAIYWDLGRGLGVLMTGQIVQEMGARWTFRSYAIVCAAAFPLFYVLDRLWPMPQTPSNDTE